MSVSEPKDAPIATLAPLCVGLAGAHLVGLGITLGIARLAAWNSESGLGIVGSGVLGMAAVAIGAACGLSALVTPSSRALGNIGLRVMVSSVTRMLVALASALVFFFVTQNQPHTLFVAVLACGILCLIVETVWALSAVRRAPSRTPILTVHPDPRGAHAA